MRNAPGTIVLALILAFASVTAITAQGPAVRGSFGRSISLYDQGGVNSFPDAEWAQLVHRAYVRENETYLPSRRQVNQVAPTALKAWIDRITAAASTAEIQGGQALNALLLVLSDPGITLKDWRAAEVPLPDAFTLRRLSFRYASAPGEKRSEPLSGGIIAPGKLDLDGRWPSALLVPELAPERQAFEAARAKLMMQSKGGGIAPDAVRDLDRAVEALRKKAATAVPEERGFRASAIRHLDGLRKATRMFDATTADFADAFLKDTGGREPATVQELVAFMRKYKLVFAAAEKGSEAEGVHEGLYEAFQRQRKSLGREFAVPDNSRRGATFNSELIKNPGCEETSGNGDIPSWEPVRGGWKRAADMDRAEGTVYFSPSSGAEAELRQDVDVGALSDDIDTRKVMMRFSGLVRSWDQQPPDTSRIVVELYAANKVDILDRLDTGELGNTAGWHQVGASRLMPKGTRWIRIRLLSRKNSGGSNDGCYDALSLTAVKK